MFKPLDDDVIARNGLYKNKTARSRHKPILRLHTKRGSRPDDSFLAISRTIVGSLEAVNRCLILVLKTYAAGKFQGGLIPLMKPFS
jgi:hypothetical protein